MKLKYIIPSITVVLLGFWLVPVFSGHIILPQILNLGPFRLHYYGLILGASAVAAYLFAQYRRSKVNLSEKQIDQLLLVVLVSGFIGARLYHVVSDLGYYAQNISQIFAIWRGGLSIYGAVIGGMVGVLLSSVVKGAFLNVLDWLVPSVLLGQIVGRFANLFNYELFGYPTGLPWKMFVPEYFRPEEFVYFGYFHPLFLYEALGNLVILIFVLGYERKSLPAGRLFLVYVLLYNTLRFSLEFLRIDAEFIGNYRQNALVSLALILASSIGLLYVHNRKIPQNQ